jgi:cytochrome b561
MSKTRYTPTAIGLHWLIGAGIIAMLAIGLYMESLPFGMGKFQLIQFHKSLGITILALAAIRLLWRFTNPAPRLAPATPAWQKAIAHSTHWLLYGLMFAMPVSGWVMSDFAGYHPSLFGLPLPVLVQPNAEAAKVMAERHEQLAWVLMALLAAHIGAALYHHVWQSDDTLRRMLPLFVAKRLPQPNVKALLGGKAYKGRKG